MRRPREDREAEAGLVSGKGWVSGMWNAWTSADTWIFETALGVNGENVINLMVTGRRGGDGEVAAWDWQVWSDRLRAGTSLEQCGSASSLREGQRAAVRAAGRLLPCTVMPAPVAAGRRQGEPAADLAV
jgi:hypothetical protein